MILYNTHLERDGQRILLRGNVQAFQQGIWKRENLIISIEIVYTVLHLIAFEYI